MVVWVVDDDAIDRFILNRILLLQKSVVSTSYFADGREVIRRLAADDSPNVIFLDINMPVMDGWQFLEAYSGWRETTKKRVSIIVASSSLSKSDHIRALQYPDVRYFVVKPFNEDKLIHALQFVGPDTAATG